MRLNVPLITASFLFSASNTRLYKLMSFTLVILPSIVTLRGTPLAALRTTSFSSIRQYNLGRSLTNSNMRLPLCSFLKIGSDNFLLKSRNDESVGTCSWVLLVRNSSSIDRRNSYLCPARRNRMTCTSHTSCEQCCPCHSVVQSVNQYPIPTIPPYRMWFSAHCNRNRI